MTSHSWNEDCVYFNIGGCSERGYTSYPIDHGERCEYHKRFFSGTTGFVYPDCNTCPVYEVWESNRK